MSKRDTRYLCDNCNGRGGRDTERWSDAIGSTIADWIECSKCDGTGHPLAKPRRLPMTNEPKIEVSQRAREADDAPHKAPWDAKDWSAEARQPTPVVEALGDALHGLSARMLVEGAFETEAIHTAYERVVKAFAAFDAADLSQSTPAVVEALREFIYETTHLSPEEDDGSHWCKISAACLANGRAALSAAHQPQTDPQGEAVRDAESIVNSDRALSVYASCEWDELGDDGKNWVAAIVDEARANDRRVMREVRDWMVRYLGHDSAVSPIAWIDAAIRQQPEAQGED